MNIFNNNTQIRILCVDDERNILKALERVFLDDDYEIITADSGNTGLEIMEERGPFQLVVSDYRMPVMNGVEFLRAVYEKYPDTVRIVLSGYADAGAIVAAINEGHIYKFVPKPWNDDELRVTIQNCLERYFLQESNRELLARLENANRDLEDKINQRTEQLELRNHALEFSQCLLGSLPVGVVGIDQDGMIAYCNDRGPELMKIFCSEILGGDIYQSCSAEIAGLYQRVRTEKIIVDHIMINNAPFRVKGHIMEFYASEAVVLVFFSE